MVTEVKQKENLYQEAFRTLQENREVESSSWLSRLRENAMERFLELGFPSVKEEEWKYTNVAAIAKADLQPAVSSAPGAKSDAVLKQLGSVPEARASQLVFIDGALQKNLSSLAALGEQVARARFGNGAE